MAIKPIQMLPMTKLTSDSLESVRNASLIGAIGAGETLQSFMNIKMIEETNALVSENTALKAKIAALEAALKKQGAATVDATSTPAEVPLTKSTLQPILEETRNQVLDRMAKLESMIQTLTHKIDEQLAKYASL